MQAINEIERSQFTEPIVLKTQEEAPTEAPSNVQVQTGGESELIVTWQVCQFIHCRCKHTHMYIKHSLHI